MRNEAFDSFMVRDDELIARKHFHVTKKIEKIIEISNEEVNIEKSGSKTIFKVNILYYFLERIFGKSVHNDKSTYSKTQEVNE